MLWVGCLLIYVGLMLWIRCWLSPFAAHARQHMVVADAMLILGMILLLVYRH